MSTNSENVEKKGRKAYTILETSESFFTNTTTTSNPITHGLSVRVPNKALESYTKSLKDNGKGFKMKHLGRLLTIMALNKLNLLNCYVSFEYIAGVFDLNTNVSPRRLKSDVRKVLNELYPTIEYKEGNDGIKFTHIPEEPGNVGNYTQLYCELLYFTNKDVMTLFTVLEYFKGCNREINPSISTLCKMTGCSKRDKINYILKELAVTEERNGLWKITSTKGGSKRNTNRYELSYINNDGIERYYLLDYLEARGIVTGFKKNDCNVKKPKFKFKKKSAV